MVSRSDGVSTVDCTYITQVTLLRHSRRDQNLSLRIAADQQLDEHDFSRASRTRQTRNSATAVEPGRDVSLRRSSRMRSSDRL